MKAVAALKVSPLFRALDRRSLRALGDAAEWCDYRGGDYLFRRGQPGDALFLVVHGRVRVSRSADRGAEAAVVEAGLGQTVGEVALVTGEPRVADALALRDSRVLRISQAAFETVVQRHPAAMLALVRQLLERQRHDVRPHPRDRRRSARTYALVPAHDGIDIRGIGGAFSRTLAGFDSLMRLDPSRVDQALGEGAAATDFEAEGNARVAGWLNRLEDAYRYLVYQATGELDAWTRRCVRQADRIVVIAHRDRDPAGSRVLAWLREAELRAPVELLLIGRDGEEVPTDGPDWQSALAVEHQHRIDASLPAAALGRAVRLISGQALCVVLGGGGARGFAHVGLLRALEDRGLAVDAVGGTSMGAFVAGLVACGHDSEAVLDTLRDTFVAHNHLNDYSFSRVSLISGQKFRRQLLNIFGERRIEDLPMPFFCESTNLTRGLPVIHNRGRLADWVGTSMAVPGIAPPTVYQGDLLVDGGLMRSIPFETMHGMGLGPVLVSDVSRNADLRVEQAQGDLPELLSSVDGAPRRLNIFKILFQSATLTSERETRELDRQADLVLHMPVGKSGMFDWDDIDDIVYRAYHHADEQLDRWTGGGPAT